MLTDRALAGEGIVMGRAGPIDQFLQAGTLVQAGAPVQRPDSGFFLLPGGELASKPATRQIQDWLLQQTFAQPG